MKKQIFATLVAGSLLTCPGFTEQSQSRVRPAQIAATSSRFLNISTRAQILTGDNVLIAGFIVTGTEPKRVIVRALGPSLSLAGILGALADPTLELYDGAGQLLAQNDNWQDAQKTEIEGTTIPPSHFLEAAMVATLPSNGSAYTAVLRGKGSTTGVGVIEVYDLDGGGTSRLANVSSRSFVQTGEKVMIAGLIVGGDGNADILFRGIGPSLAQVGVAQALLNPTVEVRDANGGLIGWNDNWKETQRQAIESTGLAPSNDAEAAILVAVPPGLYTSILRGSGETVGIGVIEAYRLQPQVAVPDLTGLSTDAAASALSAATLNVGIITGETSPSVPAGVVIRQNPVAGSFSAAGDVVDLIISLGAASGLPADPGGVAPIIGPNSDNDFGSTTAFLYSGANPIQTGLAPGAIDRARAAVLKGRVLQRNGNPLPGVRISILGHSEFGQTQTRADGAFDIVVNGGGQLTVKYEREGFISAQRSAVPSVRDSTAIPDIVMIPYDPVVTALEINASAMQAARGSKVTDTDGSRQATVLVPAGTTGEMVMSNGSRVALNSMHLRATEYTIGSSGPKAMPAALPPSSGYTYCVELSLDEAVGAGAAEVVFNKALPVYVENFLGFPAGTAVPAGYYDRSKGQWVASPNGRVLKVVAVGNGMADIDSNGDSAADDASQLAGLGITSDERMRVAQLYSAGQTLWRIQVSHFSPHDLNWPFGPPSDAAPPPEAPANNPPIDNSNVQCGSVIGCEDQTLGESVPVVGTPWILHYKSDRTPGRKERYTVDVPVSGAAALPSRLRSITARIVIAGRVFTQTFAPAPNLSYSVTWDGRDAYGRLLPTSARASVSVEYQYAAQYYAVSADQTNAFARAEAAGGGVAVSRAGGTVTLSQNWTQPVGAFDARLLGLNGWSLNIQHAYDPNSHLLMLGDGRQRRIETIPPVISTVAGNGATVPAGNGGAATAAGLNGPAGVAAASDGSFYVAEENRHVIRRVAPDGIITTVVGNGTAGFSGDGGPATSAQIKLPHCVAVAPDGSLIVGDTARIRRVDPNGLISTLAGDGTAGFSGDGGPATAARIRSPSAIAVGADGSIFFGDGGLTNADGSNQRVRRIGTDGIITTVAGTNSGGNSGDGGPATAATISNPVGVAVAPDGTFYIVSGAGRVRRVSPAGIISTVAGDGTTGFAGDGGPAINAKFNGARRIALTADGSLLICDFNNNRVRRVSPDGIITTMAGNGSVAYGGDGGPPEAAGIYHPLDVAVGADGSVLIVDSGNRRIRQIEPPFAGFSATDSVIPSEDGREVYVFNANGRHLKTLDALTAAPRYQFNYDNTGYLTGVTDESGNITSIERNGTVASAILAPGGQRTTLAADQNGWLTNIANPAGESHTMAYSDEGLLQTFTDPRGAIHTMAYDAGGRLTKDQDPAGGSISLTRTEQSHGYTVTTTSALGRVHVYQVEQLRNRDVRRTVTDTGGAKTETIIRPDSSEFISLPTGETLAVDYGPDPRWGMVAPVPTKLVAQTPFGLTRTITTSRTAALSDPSNLLSLTKLTTTETDNGSTSTQTYDGPTRSLTLKTAVGRTTSLTLDAAGRIAHSQIAGLDGVSYAYDARGRLTSITQGSGGTARNSTFTYNTRNELVSFQDALSHTVSFEYDVAGRETAYVLPDNTTIGFGYDANGNVVSVTPPSKPPHNFAYTPIDLVQSYTPPDIGIGDNATRYTYDVDRAPTRFTRPDTTLIDFGYDTGGRLARVELARGAINSGYDSAGRLSSRTAPGGLGLSYTYDGDLLTGITATGPAPGTVTGTYDARFQLISTAVNSANTISLGYDADSLIVQAGALSLARSAQSGLVTATTLGVVSDVRSYNSFGELANYLVTINGSSQFSVQYTRNAHGQIIAKSETIAGVTDTYAYFYDVVGRLVAVQKNGAAFENYGYDANGNRLVGSVAGVQKTGSYDAQDRLQQYGTASYTYAAAGALKTKTSAGQTISYSYDELENLTGVSLPNAQTIEYLIDGENRRVGKRVNGALVQGFLYQSQLAPVAELDGTGNVISRFIYATHANVPEYIIKSGSTYRIITDQLGSPRLIINSSSGAIVQRIDYDSFGNVLHDTNPGFQPFGFAGGLYDSSTKLVRFGARDYDGESGRWTSKDPILFAGKQSNLYVYSLNDPVNYYDAEGLDPITNFKRLPDFNKAYEQYKKAKEYYKKYKKLKKLEKACEKFLENGEKEASTSDPSPRKGLERLKDVLDFIPDKILPLKELLSKGIDTAREAPGGVRAADRAGRTGTTNVNAANQLHQLGL